MSKEKPEGFKDLDAAELYRSALEDFAVPVEPEDKGKKKVLLAAFAESGVEWTDYVAQHPEVAPEPVAPEPVEPAAPVYEPTLANTVESVQPLEPTEKWAEPEPEPAIVVDRGPQLAANQQWLIKMERPNALYEVRGHRFTQDHPYALVTAADAEYILSKEDGFRQAYPSEVQEFYG